MASIALYNAVFILIIAIDYGIERIWYFGSLIFLAEYITRPVLRSLFIAGEFVVLYLCLLKREQFALGIKNRHLLIFMTVNLILRFVMVFPAYHRDLIIYSYSGQALANGQNPYLEILTVQRWKDYLYSRYPYERVGVEYPPLALLVMAPIALFTSDPMFFKIPSFSADLANIYLVRRIAAKFYDKPASNALALIYAYSPAMVIASLGGWYDPVCLFLLMASILYYLNEKPTYSAISLGLAIMTKWFPLLFLLPLLIHHHDRRFLKYVIITFAVCLAISIPFMISNLETYLFQFKFHLIYRGTRDIGYSIYRILNSYFPEIYNYALIFQAGAVAAILALRREDIKAGNGLLLKAFRGIITAFLVLNRVFSAQYLIFPYALLSSTFGSSIKHELLAKSQTK
ncbi:DUF2029 domain-containing protein [Candidatus Bathyarchaeota archaeon]|nr:DUF2029 domain-containing protein [Candidatus Bathyarchaeota archaeon]